MPAHMTTGREARRVFMDNGGVYHVDPPSMPPGVYRIQQPRAGSSLAALLGRATQDAGLIDLLTSLLTLDPERRPTALVARQHVWLRAAPAPAHVEPFAAFSTSVLGATHEAASPSCAIETETPPTSCDGSRNGSRNDARNDARNDSRNDSMHGPAHANRATASMWSAEARIGRGGQSHTSDHSPACSPADDAARALHEWRPLSCPDDVDGDANCAHPPVSSSATRPPLPQRHSHTPSAA